MQDVLSRVTQLHRPRLLVRTARHGIADYDRVTHLRRLIKGVTLPGPAQAIVQLLELEAMAEEQRTTDRAEYSVARHVELIVALMCEARILKASQAARDRAASVRPLKAVASKESDAAPAT